MRFPEVDAEAIPFAGESFDAAVSGLVLNFVSDPSAGLREMARVTRSGGMAAVYVWDYAGKTELMRYFWGAAVELSPEARELDEGRRLPIRNHNARQALFKEAGLEQVQVRNIDVPTCFEDFDDYSALFWADRVRLPDTLWRLEVPARDALRGLLKRKLPADSDGRISLTARALAARGIRRRA